MNISTHQNLDRNAATIDAEQSLRLIASLPAPVGLEDRVKSGLRSSSSQTSVIAWPLSSSNRSRWAQASYLRAAAAAAIVLVVAGGGWGVYARFGQAPAPAADAVQQRIDLGGGLSPAGARRTPTTVEGPVIAVPSNASQQTDAGGVSAQKPSHGRHEKKSTSSIPVTAPAVR